MALNIFKSAKGRILTEGGFMPKRTFKATGVKPPKLTSVKNIKSLLPKKLTFLTPSVRKNKFF